MKNQNQIRILNANEEGIYNACRAFNELVGSPLADDTTISRAFNLVYAHYAKEYFQPIYAPNPYYEPGGEMPETIIIGYSINPKSSLPSIYPLFKPIEQEHGRLLRETQMQIVSLLMDYLETRKQAGYN